MALLHSLKAEVRGYALPPAYQQGLFDRLRPLNVGESILADIRDREGLRAAIHDFKPDYIFHLAAQPLVRNSYAQPTETFDINVTGTASLLEAVHHLEHACAIVVVTTDKVYQNKEQHILYREDDALGGYDPYSASKACAELVVNAFRSSFFNPDKVQQHHKGIASHIVRIGEEIIDPVLLDLTCLRLAADIGNAARAIRQECSSNAIG